MSVLCLVMHVLCVYVLNFYMDFLGQSLGFFGEDRLATLMATHVVLFCERPLAAGLGLFS